MYPDKTYQSQVPEQQPKMQERPQVRYQEMITAVKKPEERSYFTQPTPKPPKKVLLYGQDNKKHLFPLVRDRDIGITSQYQQFVHESYNDDDKQTSSTQMHNGMVQTLEDLYGELCQRSKR